MSWQRSSQPRARPIRPTAWTRVLFRNWTSPATLTACISNADVAETNQFKTFQSFNRYAYFYTAARSTRSRGSTASLRSNRLKKRPTSRFGNSRSVTHRYVSRPFDALRREVEQAGRTQTLEVTVPFFTQLIQKTGGIWKQL